MRSSAPFTVTSVAVLAALAATVAIADDVDDFVAEMKRTENTWSVKEKRSKEMKELDELGQKRFPDRVYRAFAGVFNHVNFKKLGDKDWEVPGMPYDTKQTYDRRGPQIRGRWSNGKKGVPEDQVTCVVVSFEHGTAVSFESLKREVDPVDQKALLTAFHAVSKAGLAAVPDPAEGEDPKKPTGARKTALDDLKKCAAPKKRNVGKICRWFAATQGLVTAKAERERREWYSWSDKDRSATFVLFVRFHESALDHRKTIGKGESFAKALSDGR